MCIFCHYQKYRYIGTITTKLTEDVKLRYFSICHPESVNITKLYCSDIGFAYGLDRRLATYAIASTTNEK